MIFWYALRIAYLLCVVKSVWHATYGLCTLSPCRPAGSECLGLPRRRTSGLFGGRSCKLRINKNTACQTAAKLHADKNCYVCITNFRWK